MIQQFILILIGLMLLYQVGILQLDKVIGLFIPTGYESDEDCSYESRKKQSRHSKTSSTREKSKDKPKEDETGFTPIQSILKNKQNNVKLRGEEILYPWDTKGSNDDTIEDIQTKIMSELNTKEHPTLTPVSY
jgi:hypothetical protein